MSFLISDAYAEAAPAATGSDPISSLIFFGGFILIFYFILIRPQQKRQKEQKKLISELQKGDKVVTSGGIHGVISNLKDNTVSVKVADSVKLEITRANITRVESKTGD